MKPSVLIVDDSLTVRMDLNDAFQAAGFDARTCGSVAEVRQALQEARFSLLILDVLLPDGDGVDLLAEIRGSAQTATIPILLLSTEAHVHDRVRGMRTGADEYIGKPYDLAYVIARAKEILQLRAPLARSLAAPTVLVIDDSLTFREVLRGRLEAAGYAVVTAASGEEGLVIAADTRPAAVVVDGVLPGIDGATVVRRLRLDVVLRRTPCMLLTASGDRSAELLALDSGADAFVRKDEDVEMVLARVGAIMRSAGGGSDGDAPLRSLGPKKILAVDDSPTYLQALASQLVHDGYDVVLAGSGEEALDLLAVQPVDCILMDLMMPGLSGQEACRRIKGSPVTRDIPLMMLTALEERSAMLEGMSAGADDYIPKSGDFEVLRARLRAQLRRRQFEDENRQIREKLLVREFEAAEARAARDLAAARAELLADLERKNAELDAARRRLEENLAVTTAAKLAADEANHELESFSYSVSHDLRAPLRAINGFTRVLLEDHGEKLDGEGQRVAEVILRNTAKMGNLIDDLLSFSRLGRKRAESSWLDMTALAREAADEVADRARRIEFSIEELPQAWGDAAMIRQVWLNLLGNAVKYTRPREAARVRVTAQTTQTEISYRVEDNGVGFDGRYKDKLFGVFQRLHSDSEFEGTGVGLALVQRVVRRHGGWVAGESELGQGAAFTFALPRKDRTDGP